jgi:hypothetical protein
MHNSWREARKVRIGVKGYSMLWQVEALEDLNPQCKFHLCPFFCVWGCHPMSPFCTETVDPLGAYSKQNRQVYSGKVTNRVGKRVACMS